jgi:hypothetical protein
MAANSKHYGDVYRWIQGIIDSCTQTSQEGVVKNLIDQFCNNLEQSGEVDIDTIHEMKKELKERLYIKVHTRQDKVLIKG